MELSENNTIKIKYKSDKKFFKNGKNKVRLIVPKNDK